MRKIALILYISLSWGNAYSQCCSAGNPVGGTSNVGILDKNALRTIAFYQYSESSGYWQGSQKSDFSFVKNANYNYSGIVISYGLLNKLTIETELGYYINKSQTYDIEPVYTNTGFGLDNGVFSLKYNIFLKTEKSFEWTLGGGVKFPFTSTYQIVNNVELPRDVQPSTHAFGIVWQSFLYKGLPEKRARLFLINRLELNYPDDKGFKYGSLFMSSFFISKQIKESKWTLILQLRNEYRAIDINNANCVSCFATGNYVNSTGGDLIFMSPQVNYTVAKKWNISLLGSLPLYRYYRGTQLGNIFSLSLYISRDFWQKECEKN